MMMMMMMTAAFEVCRGRTRGELAFIHLQQVPANITRTHADMMMHTLVHDGSSTAAYIQTVQPLAECLKIGVDTSSLPFRPLSY